VVYTFFNQFVSSDDEQGAAAVMIGGTATCVATPDPLLLVSALLSSDPEELPPMSKSSMRPAIVAGVWGQGSVKKVKYELGKRWYGKIQRCTTE
jgi:hypothetical protein